jgi:transcriptional regulator with XRE-family HTH domain
MKKAIQKIKLFMTNNHLNIKDLEKQTGLSYPHIVNLLAGRVDNPTLKTMLIFKNVTFDQVDLSDWDNDEDKNNE